MAIKPDLVVDYARDFQKLEIAADRAAKIAGELDRLVAGVFAVAAEPAFSDDPAEFLAVLLELRDETDRGDE